MALLRRGWTVSVAVAAWAALTWVASTGAEAVAAADARAGNNPLVLWYPRPAERWVEALPVGNGRLGAMVFGGVGHERLQLNEDTLWAGGPYDPANPQAFDAYAAARQLIFAGKQKEAEDLILDKGMGTPMRQASYQTLGDLLLDCPAGETGGAPADYRRSLDLDTATATTTYKVGGTTHTRQVFASAADQVLVVRLTADKPRSVNVTARMTTPQKPSELVAREGGVLSLTGTSGKFGTIPGQVKFEALVRARSCS